MVVQPGVLVGRYQIESLIGRGGMGEVCRARDTTLGREVAIKALLNLVQNWAQEVDRLAPAK